MQRSSSAAKTAWLRRNAKCLPRN